MLNQLILHRAAVAQLALRRVSAVEAHEGIGQRVIEPAANVLFIDVAGHGVVDVQQRHRVAGNARADVFAQRAVNVHLARHGNAARGQTAVDKAGFEAELPRERRPALVGERDVLPRALVRLRPVQQRQLKLRHALVQVGVIPSLAHLLRHIGAHLGDAPVARVGMIADQQVELAVLFNFHAQLIQSLNGRVAGEEVLRARAEGDDFESLQTQNGARDGHEFANALGQLLRRADGRFGNVRLQVAHAQIVGAVQHAAVRVAAAVDHISVALGRRHEHARAVKVGGDQRFRRFRAKVAKEDHQRAAAVRLHVGHGGKHVLLVFHRHRALVQLARIRLHNRGAAALGQRNGEAVAAHGHNAEPYLRKILNHT